MKIEDLEIPEKLKEYYRQKGINELYPPQKEAVKKGVLDGQNIVAAVPTASGKTFIAELAMASSENSLYIVPLRALAREKYDDFKDIPGFYTDISTGDYDKKEEQLGTNDIIVSTSEKVDSLIRNNVSWINNLDCIVIDEIHLLDSGERGPTLEMVIAKLRRLNPDLQIIGLSATIKNAGEIAGWLDAVLIESSWRPVPLKKGVFDGKAIEFEDGDRKKIHGDTEDLVEQSITNGGQCLVFVNSRRNSQALAKRIAKRKLNNLDDLSKEVQDESNTDTGEQLVECIKGGVAFHHAGLKNFHRSIVEDNFRSQDIKAIVATPTLAAGVNLPARRVIVRDHQRYTDVGMQDIPVLEIHQMFGRAGRPGLDPYGEAIIVEGPKSVEDLYFKYIEGDPEPAFSKLAGQKQLRSHILSSIASEFARSKQELMDLLDETFHAYQEGEDLSMEVKRVLRYLNCIDMIEVYNGMLNATGIGKQVSKFYIDPMTGARIEKTLEKANKGDIDATPLTFLEAICHTPDMRPLYLRKGEKEEMKKFGLEHKEELVELNFQDEDWLSSLKTAKLLFDWIEEKEEEDITSKYGVGPGDIRGKVDNAEWLLQAAGSLASFIDSSFVDEINNLRFRVSYGVKEEVLDLISIKGIGRVRARKLYNNDIRDKQDLKEKDPENIQKILGPQVAINILKELGLDIEKIDEKKSSGQKNIEDF